MGKIHNKEWAGSSVRTGWTAGAEFSGGAMKLSFSSLPRPDRFEGSPSLLSKAYQQLFLTGKTAGTWRWTLTSI